MGLMWTALLAGAGIWSGLNEGPLVDGALWVPAEDPQCPIFPPIVPGTRPNCDMRPDRDATLRKYFSQTRPESPLIKVSPDDDDFEFFDVEVFVERILDEVDPPRFYPLIGPAQLHHCRYRCTLRYTEIIQPEGFPWPCQYSRPRTAIVFVDRDHLHLCSSKEADGDASVPRPDIDALRKDIYAPSPEMRRIEREFRRWWISPP